MKIDDIEVEAPSEGAVGHVTLTRFVGGKRYLHRITVPLSVAVTFKRVVEAIQFESARA